jgi:hypothetical protein
MRILTCFVLLSWSANSISQNLVANSDFDDGLNGWVVQNATASVNTTDGLPNQPSAQLTTTGGVSGTFLSNCIPYDPANVYTVQANARVLDGATSLTLIVEGYSDSVCSDAAAFARLGFDSAYQATWQVFPASVIGVNQFSYSGSVPVAVRVGFDFGGGAPGNKDVLFDHVDFRIQGSTPVRLQSFGVD